MDPSDQPKTNFTVASAYVDYNLKRKSDGELESASGAGSTVAATKPIRVFLEKIIQRYGVQSILDLGCGDWNWMRHVSLNNHHSGELVRYQGWESNKTLVADLNKAYGAKTVSFYHKDVATEAFPFVDLIIARDVLGHMPMDIAQDVIARAQAASRFFLATSQDGTTKNTGPKPARVELAGWGFYPVNLTIAPFNLDRFIRDSADEPDCGGGRRAVLFDFSR